MSNTDVHTRVLIHRSDDTTLDITGRVVDIRGGYGRQSGTQEFNIGSATVKLQGVDNFITPGSDSTVSAEELVGEQCIIGCAAITAFGGWITKIDWEAKERYQLVSITVKDALQRLSRVEVELPANLPQEPTGHRIHRILDLAGWSSRSPFRNIDEGVRYCVPTTKPIKNTALNLLRQVAFSEGGRLYVTHGRVMLGKDWDLGVITFEQLGPPPEPILHVSTERVHTRAFYNVRPANKAAGAFWRGYDPGLPLPEDVERLEVGVATPKDYPKTQTDTSELFTRFEFTDGRGKLHIKENLAATIKYGGKTLRRKTFTSQEDTLASLAWWDRSYSSPRYFAKEVPLEPHFEDLLDAIQIMRSSLNQSVLLTYQPPGTEEFLSTWHRVDSVNFNIKPMDSTVNAPELQVKLGLQTPEASAFWLLDVEGATELEFTTVLASDQPTDPGKAELTPPKTWLGGDIISAPVFQAELSNKMTAIYSSDDEREQLDYKPVIVEGRQEPVDGATSVITDRDQIKAWKASAQQQVILASVAPGAAPGIFTLDDPVLGLLDYGNRLG